MSVANKIEQSSFRDRDSCEYDESWVVKLLKECDQNTVASPISEEELDRIELLDEDILQFESTAPPPSPVVSRMVKTQQTNANLKKDTDFTPSAIELQIMALDQAKRTPNSALRQPSGKSKGKKGIRALFRLS